jgi:AcrR family transcriptional regulator
VTSNASTAGTGLVLDRRRAVALARNYREFEGLSIREIADRLGRSPATVKAYFYDPTGEKARAVKARYVGVCRGCGAYTQPRNGKGDAYSYCKACHPGAIQPRWTPERVLAAMRDWHGRYGPLPSSYDWSPTHARRRGGEALRRLAGGEWPASSVVTSLFGTWSGARAVAAEERTREPVSASSSFARESISLPKPRESNAKTEDLRGGEPKPEPTDLQVLLTKPPDFAHNSVGEVPGSNPGAPIFWRICRDFVRRGAAADQGHGT